MCNAHEIPGDDSQGYVDLGIDYFMPGARDVSDLTAVELIAREVLPHFKRRIS